MSSLRSILVMMPVIATLTLTWMERKVIGRIQNRIGPEPRRSLGHFPGHRRRGQDAG